MLNSLRNFLSTTKGRTPTTREPYSFRWHEPGAENPFGVRVLDCRPLTRTLTTGTGDQDVAERFVTLRGNDGRDLIGGTIADATHVATSLRLPHDGSSLHGVVFKASSMDVKWDIYYYDSEFLFARSWTGDLCFRARAAISASDIRITSIECRQSVAALAASHVYFLLVSHAMGLAFPHRVSDDVPNHPMAIAMASFQIFGNRAWYATFEDITQIPPPRPRTETASS